MRHFLVFMIEPYRLMVDALRVRELRVQGGPGQVCGGGHVAWRDRLVPTVGLAALLGRDAPHREDSVDVICGDLGSDGRGDGSGAADADTLVVFGVDRVLGLRAIRDTELRPLPPLATPTLVRLFGGLVLDPVDGKGILWLKARADALLAFGQERRAATPALVPVGPGYPSLP